MILTRIDRPGERSVCWVTGDRAESCSIAFRRSQWADGGPEMRSEIVQRKRFELAPDKTAYYGGGFWEKVTIGPAESAPDHVCAPVQNSGYYGLAPVCYVCGQAIGPAEGGSRG